MYTYTYDGQSMWRTFNLARNAVHQVLHDTRMEWLNSDDEAVMHRCSDYRQDRLWLVREMDKYPLHPVIEAAIKLSRPHNWHLMFFEWPHVSEGDRARIAYTQSIDKGRRDLQTVTSVGKYLRRHFPAISDHDIRDLVSRYGSADTYKFVSTTAEMIYHLHRGPGSCMVWGENRAVRCHDGVDRHPYEAYNPKYGWHMAVRICGDDTVGRALCMTKPDGHKYFVRTYARPANGTNGYSQADNGMENWLSDQGYSKHSSWDDGEKLAYHGAGDHFLAPYLDGGDKCVSVHSDEEEHWVMVDTDGDYICDQTGGVPTYEDEDCFDCEDCGDSTSDDDGYWVGYNDDTHVCESCYENEYVYGYGRNGRQYSFSSGDAVYVDSQQEYYHTSWLDANNIVELANGEYEHTDDAVEVGGEWYHIDDENICRTTDTDEFLLKDDGCWQCAESGDWYTDSVDYVEIDNTIYHPDHAPATDDDDDEAVSEGDTAVAVAPVVTAPVVNKQLTIEMLNECALVEEYDHLRQRVTYSLTIMHNGLIFSTNRSYRNGFIASQGVDWMRMNVRRVLSNELLGLPQSSTETL